MKVPVKAASSESLTGAGGPASKMAPSMAVVGGFQLLSGRWHSCVPPHGDVSLQLLECPHIWKGE